MDVATLTDFLKKIKCSPVEMMGVIYHNENGIAGARIVGTGTINGCKFNFKDILNGVTEYKSVRLTLVHNHPRDNVRPSVEDLETTYQIIDRCKPMGITIRDHLILGKTGGVYSFSENGAL